VLIYLFELDIHFDIGDFFDCQSPSVSTEKNVTLQAKTYSSTSNVTGCESEVKETLKIHNKDHPQGL